MTLAVVRSRAIDGIDAPAVLVEVHLANGLPSFTLVGLADTEVKEGRERVRAALAHSGLGLPSNKRVTVNLARAELAKESGRFALPIALAILAAAGQIDAKALDAFELAGKLSLASELRPVRGAMTLALAVRGEGAARSRVLPATSASEAHCPGSSMCAARRTCSTWWPRCSRATRRNPCRRRTRWRPLRRAKARTCATCAATPLPSVRSRLPPPGATAR